MNELDLFVRPLTGTKLIEASAGTGKTYTISALVLRLLVEEGCEISRILVVTFSEAAASDLRRQVRERIHQAHEAFLDPQGEEDDEFLACLLKRCPDRALAVRRLAAALQSFDEAAIYTIHGFCLRVLQDNSLAGRILFDASLNPDPAPLVSQVAEDFFRDTFYQSDRDYAATLAESFRPGNLRKFLRGLPLRPGMAVLPGHRPTLVTVFTDLAANLREAIVELGQKWPVWRGEVAGVLEGAMTARDLDGRSYRAGWLPGWLTSIDSVYALSTADPSAVPLPNKALTAEHLRKKTKKDRPTPQHPAFVLIGRIYTMAEEIKAVRKELVVDLAGELLRRAGAEIAETRARLGEMTFDDLLVNLEQSLSANRGLAEVIAKRYPHAFIDEFQDTDYLQFAIFRAIYQERGKLLYLIGDPKQSIYSFRGADLRVYLAAREKVGREFPLDRNYRSTPVMVEAVNRIFSHLGNPFLIDSIGPFPKAKSAARIEDELAVDGEGEAAMRIVLCRRPEELVEIEKPLTNGKAEEMTCDWLVGEIRGLVEKGARGKAMIGERPLTTADIAVLVRKNDHARMVQERLAEAGVASVLYSGASVFASREARDLLVLLTAVDNPLDQHRLRAALLTPFFGLAAAGVDFAGREDELESWRERFLEWRDLWHRRGVLLMLRVMARQCGIKKRLAALFLGERRLTNFFHLAELLEGKGGRGRTGARQCLAALKEEIAEPGTDNTETQLRLESDAKCVQIITMHKSKGLQYPVVFCPFLWWSMDGKNRDRLPRPLKFQDQGSAGIGLDLGTADYGAREEEAAIDELAEAIRLAYVAMTRAVYRCYLVWGVMGTSPGNCAPAYLFHQHLSSAWPAKGKNLLAEHGEDGIMADLEKIAGDGGEIEVSFMAAASPRVAGKAEAGRAETVCLSCRTISREIRPSWQNTSFSAISHSGDDLPHPLPALEDDGAAAALDAFPRGARAGLFFHKVLEEIDFAESGGWADLVRDNLRWYSFPAHWHNLVLEMLDRLINTPLCPEGPRLGLVSREKRISELEFVFPCNFTPRELAGVFAGAGRQWLSDFADRAERLSPEGISGFLKGFIDLVFEADGRYYIVDWKSNFLGNGSRAYEQGFLTASMAAAGYVLQYHLYTIALDRYLKSRLPGYCYEGHFGGVFYPYLRGVAHGAGAGVFFDRPRAEFVRALDGFFGGDRDG